jgi:ubiquinone/menaquinone biosynthesis C-methylase UbiE
LEHISVESSSIDFIIGHASLHHFIKYEKVPAEFYRVMKTGANGYFADSFGENPFYRIFHNKQRMERLGDVLLSKKLIDEYFDLFDVQLTPTDWFVMLDKLYSKIFPDNFNIYLRQLSKVHYWLDRKIPESNRIALTLSGAILTIITKPPQY